MTPEELRAAVDKLLDQVPSDAPYRVIVMAFDEDGLGDAGSSIPIHMVMPAMLAAFLRWASDEGMSKSEVLEQVERAIDLVAGH